jgi:hypothetical protein
LFLILLVKLPYSVYQKIFSRHERAMLQNLSEEIRECYLLAEQCRRWAETALTPSTEEDFLAMERRWLSLAHSYEFAERLSAFTSPFSKSKQRKNKPLQLRPKLQEHAAGPKCCSSGALV